MYTYSKALDISHVNCEIVPKPTPFIKMYLSQVYLKTLHTYKIKGIFQIIKSLKTEVYMYTIYILDSY